MAKLAAPKLAPNVQVSPEHGATIAHAYESMKHDPSHPAVKEAYGALINETGKKYQNLVNSGLKVSQIKPGQENPYKTIFAEQKAGLMPDHIVNGNWHPGK